MFIKYSIYKNPCTGFSSAHLIVVNDHRDQVTADVLTRDTAIVLELDCRQCFADLPKFDLERTTFLLQRRLADVGRQEVCGDVRHN